MVKVSKVGGKWVCCNLKTRQTELFSSLNISLAVDSLLQLTEFFQNTCLIYYGKRVSVCLTLFMGVLFMKSTQVCI